MLNKYKVEKSSFESTPRKSGSSALKNDLLEDLPCVIKSKCHTSTSRILKTILSSHQAPPSNLVIPSLHTCKHLEYWFKT